MKLNYEQDLHIDQTALDLEWLGQAQLMLKYTEASASARREVDRLKEKLSVVRAESDKHIRSHPNMYSIEKVTESIIQSTIILEDDYQKAQAELIDAQYEWQMMQGAVSAVEQRKQALENMSRLLGLQYFAGPKAPRDLPHEVRQAQQKDRTDRTIHIKRRRNT